MRRSLIGLDLFLVFAFAAIQIKPLFLAGYLSRWDSIESTFIADARFLAAHPPHPQWLPLWYCGTRYDYIYPPVLRYGSALLSYLFTPPHAYHIFTALMYAFGMAGVYFLARVLSASRAAAWLAAVSAALLSPSFLLLRDVRRDSPFLTPWRLWVLLRYGEGPHISSLSLLPFALAFAWLALSGRRFAYLAAAALFSALVALTNFYGATALAIFYPVLAWSLSIADRERRVWLRAFAIPALAYGFAAFWLTPSYLRITILNLRWVALPANRWAIVPVLVAAAIFIPLSLRAASGKPNRAYAVFLSGSLLFMGLFVLGDFYFDLHFAGNPKRLVPELDLIIILAAVELLRWPWYSPPHRARLARAAVIVIVLCALWPSRHYIRRAWHPVLYPPEPDYTQRVEYRMSEWISAHLQQSRIFVTGSIRFWWDTWHDLAQVDGGSQQGLLNQIVPYADWELAWGNDPQPSVLWLTALGADAVIAPFPQSQEPYHDFKFPAKFTGILPVLYDDHQGNVIFQVPRRFPSLARVVDRAHIRALPPMPTPTNVNALRAYTAVIEQGPDVFATAAWDDTDAMRVHARLVSGQSILVQVSYDPAWHARSSGKPLPVASDPLGFILIDAPPGDHDIALVFEAPLENRACAALTIFCLLLAAAATLAGAPLEFRKSPGATGPAAAGS